MMILLSSEEYRNDAKECYGADYEEYKEYEYCEYGRNIPKSEKEKYSEEDWRVVADYGNKIHIKKIRKNGDDMYTFLVKKYNCRGFLITDSEDDHEGIIFD